MIPSLLTLHSLFPSYLINAYDFNNQLEASEYQNNISKPGLSEIQTFISNNLFDISIWMSQKHLKLNLVQLKCNEFWYCLRIANSVTGTLFQSVPKAYSCKSHYLSYISTATLPSSHYYCLLPGMF